MELLTSGPSILAIIAVVALFNIWEGPYGLRPFLVKGKTEHTWALTEELWNSFSRVTLEMSGSMKEIQQPLIVWGSVYFLLIGLGFMFAEIGLIQRTSIFLGHPIYGLAIALFGIIASTGLGSFLSDRMMRLNAFSLVAWPLALAIYLFCLPFWFPMVLQDFESGSLFQRSAICLLGIVPSGVVMGFMFPTGMRLARRIDARPTPWFWAVNGAAGVLGSGSAVLFSIHTSLDETLKVAALCYGLLALVALMLGSLVPELEVSPGRSPGPFGNAERIRRERAATTSPRD